MSLTVLENGFGSRRIERNCRYYGVAWLVVFLGKAMATLDPLHYIFLP